MTTMTKQEALNKVWEALNDLENATCRSFENLDYLSYLDINEIMDSIECSVEELEDKQAELEERDDAEGERLAEEAEAERRYMEREYKKAVWG